MAAASATGASTWLNGWGGIRYMGEEDEQVVRRERRR